MIISKFNLVNFFGLAMLIAVTAVFYRNFYIAIPVTNWITLFPSVIIAYAWMQIVLLELNTKAIKVTMTDEMIVTRNFFGVGTRKKFYYDELDGYTIWSVSGKGGRSQICHIKKGDKAVVKLSALYHANYYHLTDAVSLHLTYLGNEDYSYLTEIKDLFR